MFPCPGHADAQYDAGSGRVRRRRIDHNGWVGFLFIRHLEEHLLTAPLATVINSDMIPFKQRGMYQAMQNILHGFGSVLGASLGGTIAETIGWRWCFLSQVPVSLVALVVGYFVLENPLHLVELTDPKRRIRSALQCLDLSGATLLVVGLVIQLLGLSFGGNEYPWSSVPVVTALVASCVLLTEFIVVEAKTKAMPMIPLRMLQGWQPSAVQLSNIFSGMAAYAVSYRMPSRRLMPDLLTDSFSPAVYVYDPLVLPSSPGRLTVQGRAEARNAVFGNADRRSDRRDLDAAREPPQL